VDWGDYDNDGDLDILISGILSSGDFISRIYRNDNGIFTDIIAGFPGVRLGSVAWGDYDCDNDLDILLTGQTNNISGERISMIYRNDNGVFNDINAGLYGTYSGSVAWGDYDNDGDLDALISGYSNILKLYRNNSGTFNEFLLGLPGIMYSSVAWGDSDNDGDLDLLVSGQSTSGAISRVYLNNSGTFTDSNAGLPAISYGSAVWGDYDNDNDLDILLTGTGISRIYKNNSSIANSVPVAPSGLTATSTGTGMVLSWNKSTDTKTPQAGLSYNLYVGTASGAVNKRTPMAILPGGFRKIVRKSALQSNSWIIKRLPAGTFYWSVQAIDNALAGSAFAAQTTFTVPFSNSVAPAADQVIAVNQASSVLTVTESSTPTSRQWKYSMVSGGPYDQTISAATSLTCSPSFSSTGTYYIICESIKGGIAYISNQVKIIVSDFSLQTGIVLPAVKNSCVKWGDYDSDGDLDIFLSGYNDIDGDISRIYHNDGGVFNNISAGLTGASGSSADWGDFDNDGDLDLIVTGSNQSIIYRDDSGVFTDISAGLAGVAYGSVAWGDYDNDGDLDILLTGNNTTGYPISTIYRNDGTFFTNIDAGLQGVKNSSVAWGDYDNDGDLDILLTGNSAAGNISKIYQNNMGLFTDINAGLTGVYNGSAAWGDYDNDGDLDIILTGYNYTFIYNNNNGNFAQLNAPVPGLNYSSAVWGDYDNDGDLDILVSGNCTGSIISKIYRNNNNVFSEYASGLIPVSNGSSAWGDYDSDGDLDILFTGSSATGSVSQIYKNTITTPNGIPSVPSGLSIHIDPNKVIFTWNKSTDSKTPQDGLSYNLSIGASSGAINIKSPMSALPGGHRKIVRYGSQGNTWHIKSLPAGTYYWSVQAIDHSFAGSQFAAEASFTINYSTRIDPIDDQNLIINQTGTGLTVAESSPPDSRQWKYSTVKGGPYDQIITGATGPSYYPVFSDWGTYYVICESIKDGAVYTSNEVKIDVPVLSRIDTNIPGVWSSSANWGDYDNDGDLDLLVTGISSQYGRISRIYSNISGTFTDIACGLPGIEAGNSDWGDYDNDGDLDVLLIGYTFSRIYNNNTFTDINAGLPTLSPAVAKWGDYDNDGDLDLVIAGSNKTLIYRNDNGIFTDINANLTGISFGSVTWGDYDNDKDLDILLTGNSSSGYISKIYRNDNGSFTSINSNIPGVMYGSAAWGDYDNDGDLDILIAGSSSTGGLITRIYRNDNGIFPDINAGLPGLRYPSLSWADYDNDGDLDVFLCGATSASGVYLTKIYKNDNGIFSEINAIFPGVQNGSAAWGDYDNDGDLDLIIVGQTSSGYIANIYRNNITATNSVPSVPANLQSVVASNRVNLSWNKSTDSKTPQNGLTYNIYVDMSPGLLGPPMSFVPGGYRKIAKRGSQLNSYFVRNLPAGTYYWSVQAIDNTFAGSAFAAEVGFTVVYSNLVSPATEQVLKLNENGTAITVTESAVATSRQWKYSTVSGGPYSQVITGATGLSYTPNFSSFGTYYIVCESVYNLNTYTSNEVKIRVPVFYEQGITLTGVYRSSVAWGDYDNDGDLDILLTGVSTSPTSKIYRNDAGIFNDINAGLLAVYGGSASWSDYDNDGDLDILLTGYASSGAVSKIYRNDAGVFTDINAGLPGIQYGSVSWGDYDNDGDQDILICAQNLTRIYRNNDGIFTDIEAHLPGVIYSSAAWGDYDNDNDLDILLTGSAGSDYISNVFRNDNGIFTDIDAGLTGVYKSSVAWGDHDNDGDLDILMSGLTTVDPVTLIYRNTGGIFTDISSGLQGVYSGTTAWGDYDNDGDLDILMSGNTNAEEISRIYRNDGGIFTDIKDGLAGVQQSSLAWGDYDKDGNLDILLTGVGTGGSLSKIYKNNTLTANTLPAAPSNLQTVIGANMVTLSWNKSTDSSTPPNGLTYNLYIGTSSGGIDVSSPHASLPGGTRRIVQAENHSNSRILKNLPADTYYWSVQAIDNSFGGSVFATEASFTINYSNSISPATDQSLAINQDGTILTVAESSPPDSRQWKYSTIKGGPYDQIISGATAATYTPRFPSWGTYYVICESTRDAVVYTSNEVKIKLPVFLEQTGIELIDLRSGTVKWGDYDNDGDLDILLTGGNNEVNTSKIYRNDNGIFTDINASLTGVYQSTAGWGDYDNDGDLDLFLAGYISSGNYCSKIYHNDSGIFTDIGAGLPGINLGTSAWVDYDNDGDLDIYFSGQSASGGLISGLYRNDNGVFTNINAGLPGIINGSSDWGDYDNDGDKDLIITGNSASGGGYKYISKIYRNDNGVFNDINADLPGLISSSVAWGDYDNDGDLDFILSGGGETARILNIYRNDGGIFTDINCGLPAVSSCSISWGDYDNDGDLDILISGGTQSVGINTYVYRNTNGIFDEIKADITGIVNGSVSWGDYNNDGNLDILISGWNTTDHFTKIYKNTGLTANTKPGASSNLTVTAVNVNKVLLSWDKASDAETTQNALNYNVRVGTTTGNSNILGPMANHTSGYRHIPARGNAEFKNIGYTLNNLSPGTYSWSVQAIDQAYSGGSWATENSFTLLEAPVATAASNVLQTSFIANWNTSALAAGYKLDVSTDASFASFLAGYNDIDVSNILNASVSGLTANTTYYYRVRAYDAGGTSLIYSNAISVTTPVEVPAPAATSATSITQTGFAANWSTVSVAKSYSLDMAADNTFTIFVTGYNDKNVGNVTTYPIGSLTANTTYYYRVRANGTVGSSVSSNIISVNTLPVPPAAPASIAAESITSAGFILKWGASMTATAYYLDISTENAFATFITGFNDFNNGSDTSKTVTGLSPGVQYYFRVRAGNSGGTGDNSTIAFASTLPDIPPAPVASAASNITQTGFKACWSSSSNATGYEIDVATDATFTSLVTGYNDFSASNVTTCDISGLTAKTQYYYRIRALNVSGTSGNSNSINVTTLPNPPAAPSGLTGTSCNDQVTLTWSANTETDFLRYRIYGGTSDNPTTKIDSTATGTISATTKTLTGLIHGQTYYFRITAVISPGVASSYSASVTLVVKKGVVPKIKSKFNDILICYNNGDSIASFQWYKGTTAISGATKQYYVTNKQVDGYSILTTDKNGCKNSSNVINITGTKSITVYPNPAQNSFMLKFNSETLGKAMITLYNSSGTKILEYQVEKSELELNYEISAGNIQDGIYTIEVIVNEEELSYSRIIIVN
jgi:predicted nucleotidyltransferase